MAITEKSVPADMAETVKNCANDALEVLGGEIAKKSPKVIVAAIDKFARKWQKGDRPPPDVGSAQDVGFSFGCLWGEQLMRQFGWQWALLETEESRNLAICSTNRSLVIYPLGFLSACLENPNIDVTVLLCFNMLMADKTPTGEPKSYTDLMVLVYRFVPGA
jgi:hypothetical protein